MMRPHAAGEQGVAVHQQVVRGKGAGDVRPHRLDELHALPRGDVLEHQAQPREALQERCQHALDEDPLAVEDVHLGVGRLAVHQQRQAGFLHARQHLMALADVRHAGIRMGGGPGRVVLHCVHDA